jgi:hypothetical protein
MRKTRSPGHRPSPATALSIAALVIALSGTAYAATGGSFILGRVNHETSTATLTDSKGTPLVLSAPGGKAPLSVSNSVQVPKLNATELDGHPATAFLRAGGTAANSNELGGQPAYDYMVGDGQVSHETGTVQFGNSVDLNLPGPISQYYGLEFECSSQGVASPDVYSIGATVGVWFLWTGGPSENYDLLPIGSENFYTGTSSAATWVLQVTVGPSMATIVWSAEVYDSGRTCSYAAQTISNG